MKKILISMGVIAVTATIAFMVNGAERTITQVTGDVYRFNKGAYSNIFVITGEGVIVTDPMSSRTAGYIKDEIGKMTDQPITHLIYSHSHSDHASGGSAYGEIPTVIAHENAPKSLDGVLVTDRFDDNHSFKVGDKTIELTYLGPGHGNDLIAMIVRPENVVFVVDAISAKKMFFRDFPNSNVADWINQVKKVYSLDFEIFVGGHGVVGTKEDVKNGLVYLNELKDAVRQGLKDGKSVKELTKTITMDKYKHWEAYDDWRASNVKGMARYLQSE